jgi:hypothetical protein
LSRASRKPSRSASSPRPQSDAGAPTRQGHLARLSTAAAAVDTTDRGKSSRAAFESGWVGEFATQTAVRLIAVPERHSVSKPPSITASWSESPSADRSSGLPFSPSGNQPSDGLLRTRLRPARPKRSRSGMSEGANRFDEHRRVQRFLEQVGDAERVDAGAYA